MLIEVIVSLPSPAVDAMQLDPLCSLDDPTRRRLYDYVVSQSEPVTRDQASAGLDIDRSTVAYHLDKLVDGELLAASFARPEGRGGPGAGRPTKHYERSDREFAVSVPSRDYHLAAELLARAAAADTFHRLAQQHTELVCKMNLAMLAAAAEATGAPFAARLDPADDRCCVSFEPTSTSGGWSRSRAHA